MQIADSRSNYGYISAGLFTTLIASRYCILEPLRFQNITNGIDDNSGKKRHTAATECCEIINFIITNTS